MAFLEHLRHLRDVVRNQWERLRRWDRLRRALVDEGGLYEHSELKRRRLTVAATRSIFESDIRFSAVGAGLSNVSITFLDPLSISVQIPAGTVFSPADPVQPMVALNTVIIEPWQRSMKIRAGCLDMYRPAPSAQNVLTAVPASIYGLPNDVRRLVARIDEEVLSLNSTEMSLRAGEYRLSDRVIQFAVWIAFHNPRLAELCPIVSAAGLRRRAVEEVRRGQSFTVQEHILEILGASPHSRGPDGVPTGQELEQIRRLFRRAGLEISAYSALQ